MKITVCRLESGYYHVRGVGPCNWAQPPHWPCDEETLRAHAFGEAAESFIRAAMNEAVVTAMRDFVGSVAVLAHHALVEIRCDHEAGRDLPICNCALVDLGWHPTVQAAKEAWARHVLDALIPEGAIILLPREVEQVRAALANYRSPGLQELQAARRKAALALLSSGAGEATPA